MLCFWWRCSFFRQHHQRTDIQEFCPVSKEDDTEEIVRYCNPGKHDRWRQPDELRFTLPRKGRQKGRRRVDVFCSVSRTEHLFLGQAPFWHQSSCAREAPLACQVWIWQPLLGKSRTTDSLPIPKVETKCDGLGLLYNAILSLWRPRLKGHYVQLLCKKNTLTLLQFCSYISSHCLFSRWLRTLCAWSGTGATTTRGTRRRSCTWTRGSPSSTTSSRTPKLRWS